eukprot:330813-Rhodomonas_salina.1
MISGTCTYGGSGMLILGAYDVRNARMVADMREWRLRCAYGGCNARMKAEMRVLGPQARVSAAQA